VEATEADERMKKNVEAEMERAKGDMKERKQKLLITAKRKERYEAMAKQKGTTAEMIEAEERETEAMKEVTEKQQMTARGSAKTEADIKAKQLEEKEEELQKEDSADSAEAASDQAAAESAAEEEAKEQADEQEASNAAAAKASEEKVSALEQAVAKAEVKKVEAEQTARAEKAQAKEEAAKEKEQKTALVDRNGNNRFVNCILCPPRPQKYPRKERHLNSFLRREIRSVFPKFTTTSSSMI